MRRDPRRASRAALLLVVITLVGCGPVIRDEWARPGATPMTRLAVLPFENQTAALRAGAVASELVVSELVSTGAVPVMEPGDVAQVLRAENIEPGDPARMPSAQRLGRLLRVSHVLQGSVTEFRYKPGISETPVVGMTARVVEVATGEIVWTASQARSGGAWFREDGLARLAQAVARDMAHHLTTALASRAR
jgi:hypothetical protein